MSGVIGFDMGVPTVSLPLAPRDVQGRLYGSNDWHESWFTVFMVLHDYGTDMSVIYSLALSPADALVKAAAYLMGKEEKREITWLEAYECLRTCTYEAFTIADSVKFGDGFHIEDRLGRDIDKLAEQEEAKRAAKEDRSQELASIPQNRPEV